MRIDKSKRIEEVISKDKTLACLTGAFLMGDKLVATDGRKLVVIQVENEEKATGTIPLAAFKHARKRFKHKVYTQMELTVNGNVGVKELNGPVFTFELVEGKFPDYEQVIPKGKRTLRVGLNAQYLADIQNALGADSVILEFASGGDEKIRQDPIRVLPIFNDQNAKKTEDMGVLMPRRI